MSRKKKQYKKCVGIPGIPGIPGILGVQPKFKSNKEAADNPPANSIEMMLSMDVENPRHPWHLRDRNGVHRWVQSLETWNESLVDGEPTLRIPRSSGIPRISRISPEDPITVVNERKPASFFLCASVVSGGGGGRFLKKKTVPEDFHRLVPRHQRRSVPEGVSDGHFFCCSAIVVLFCLSFFTSVLSDLFFLSSKRHSSFRCSFKNWKPAQKKRR